MCEEQKLGTEIKVEEQKVEKKSLKHEIISWTKHIAVGLLIGMVISSIFKIGYVSGDSMNNTLQNGDLYILDEVKYKYDSPKYKDIIVAHSDIRGGELIIKRVIGVPGDHLVIAGNHLYINGKLITEDYIAEPMFNTPDMEVDIPEGKIFVMGDNRNNSLDSRFSEVGMIDYKKDVKGRVNERIFPFNEITAF